MKSQPDWSEWVASEWKQLDQYEAQNTFGSPCSLPPGANCLSLLWTYTIKQDSHKTKKSRCVCNGRPSNPGTVTWGYTYTKALDHVGHRIFWAAVAAKNFIVRGCDASNAFAEAPPPKHPLYVRIDRQFREWWASKNRAQIPADYVLPVQKALQGHPEAPRLWATLIHGILTKELGLNATTHENCLYHGYIDGHEILFLRQVDDFVCASSSDDIAQNLVAKINSKMSIDVKDLGIVNRFNGIDIEQTRHFVKLHCKTYIEKIVNEQKWIENDMYTSRFLLPMNAEPKFQQQLESAKPPSTKEEQHSLQKKMGLKYRQAIGELLYAMVTCRPDISFPVIKLSQYSLNPAEAHYKAVKQLFLYLRSTADDGIYYWRKDPYHTLPVGNEPIAKPDQFEVTFQPTPDITRLEGGVDATWGNDSSHRKSVSGYALMLSGGCILYKTRYQSTIALSSTESEFTAACEAGESILYVRSILDQINLPQPDATVLYIDNNGALLMANAQQPTRRTRFRTETLCHFGLGGKRPSSSLSNQHY